MASNNPFQEPISGNGAPPQAENTPKVFAATSGPVVEETIDSGSPFTLLDSDNAKENEVMGVSNEMIAWEQIFSNLPQAFVILDEQQNILFSNKAHSELLGVDAASCSDMEDWFRVVCPNSDDLAKVVSSWHEHIWRNQLTRTFSLNSKNKGTRQVEFRSSLSPDGHMILMQDDVTESHASDETLRQANLKFRTLFANAPGGMVLVNQKGEVQEVNSAFLEFSEMIGADLVGKRFLDLVNSEDAETLSKAELGEVEKIGNKKRKMRFSFPSQEKDKPALVTPSYILNESQEIVYRVYQLKPRDMQLMAKLKELSSKAQALLDAVPDMFILLDKDGVIKDWSPPADMWEEELILNKNSLGKSAQEAWPEFGEFVRGNLKSVFGEGLTVRHQLKNNDESGFEYPMTLAPFGKDLALVLIEKPSKPDEPEVEEAAVAPVALEAGEIPNDWYGQFFSSSKAAVLVTSAEGEVVNVNPAASALLGQGQSALLRANLFQLLSKAPGTQDEFDLGAVKAIDSEKTWENLLSVSAAGPRPVVATVVPVREGEESEGQTYVVMVEPKREVEVDPLSDEREMAHSQFRSQLQIVTSLFSITPESRDPVTFNTWLMRLKVLAESMTTKNRVGVVHLMRDVADQVTSVSGNGRGLREVVISGSSSLTIENELATIFALLIGEVMHMGVSSSGKDATGPSIYIDVEGYEGDISLTAKPGEKRTLFTSENKDNAKVIEILVEQMRGKISVGVGEDDSQAPSIRLTFPAPQN